MNRDTPTTPDTGECRVPGEIPVPILINWLTAAAIPLLVLFAWRSGLQGDWITSPLLLTVAVLLAFNSVLYWTLENITLLRRGFLILITALFTYLAVQGPENGAAILWLFAYPPIVFYIHDARTGVIACAGGFIGLVLLFSPVGDALFAPAHDPSFRLLMLAALGFEMFTCFVLDQSRRRARQELISLASKFEYAAKHDTLTGLANRREAVAQLEQEFARYRRNARTFAILLMDIDLFKSVNDTHGHHIGDQVIVLVAQTLRDQCRKIDTIARWGGEEYLVVLPETETGEALQMAERIRKQIATSSIDVDGKPVAATISVGVASIHPSESIDSLLQRADEALYKAKSLGRNRVCAHEAEAPA
ncbi:GGDEF domain-containing protein [Marinobacter sp. F4216]|uniref:GGDEF domain-containing protein n=1 Tax=Marinobacter sp. F4216 TaxID=2874281 RepID=UPI001CC0145A|nr:GGDEF domain-containing protein [Marinobacter sp. F4216]MBZ2167209.1 GGDEF domain-containing protein [Marinobacter sp. F4216]